MDILMTELQQLLSKSKENQELMQSLGFTEEMDPPPAPSKTEGNGKGAQGTTSSVEDRALELLGSGINPEQVASALGVTPARISQLLSEEQFANKVATRRYENLQSHNVRDSKYDNIEDELLEKLKDMVPFMMKPTEVMRAVQVVNNAKRRGQSSPDQVVNSQNIVNLVLPNVIAQRFTVNIDNQVTRAGDQELLTMQPGQLGDVLEQSKSERQLPPGTEREDLETT